MCLLLMLFASQSINAVSPSVQSTHNFILKDEAASFGKWQLKTICTTNILVYLEPFKFIKEDRQTGLNRLAILPTTSNF